MLGIILILILMLSIMMVIFFRISPDPHICCINDKHQLPYKSLHREV